MTTRLRDDIVYSCPNCNSESVLWCWVDANAAGNVSIDWETDIGDSTKWHCPDCNSVSFLPTETRADPFHPVCKGGQQ